MVDYLPPKGTEDFFPADFSVRKQVLDSLRATAIKYGFLEVETPAFETTEWLTKKSGDELLGQIFTLEQRGSEKFGLRFDLTVPITRLFLQKQRELQKPVRWFGLSRMWRYEAPQKGRLREFSQLSVECFGSDKVQADAELLNLFVDCYKNLGLTSKDFKVRVNSRMLLQGLLWGLNCVSSEKQCDDVFRLVDKSSKISEDDFKKELKGVGLDDAQIKNVLEIVSLKGSPSDVLSRIDALNIGDLGLSDSLATLKNLFLFLPEEYFVMDLSIARGIAYYTGIVFEAFDVSGEFRALGGGGRYDNLIDLYGGERTPATGFGIGLSTLSLLLEKKNLIPKSKTGVDYFVALVPKEQSKEYQQYKTLGTMGVSELVLRKAFDVARELRKNSSVVIDINERKLAKQFEYAQSIGAQKVVIVGEKDLAEGKVTIRDMKTGKEEKVDI